MIKLPANSINEKHLTPDLRRKLKGDGSDSSTVYNTGNGITNPQTKYYDIICKLVTTTNIDLSSGLTYYDNTYIASQDLILVNGQTDKKQNGVYVSNVTNFTRLNFTLQTGKPIFIAEGTYKGSGWILNTEAIQTIDGTKNVEFIKVYPFDATHINGDIGFIYLYLWDLWNAKSIVNNARWDAPTILVADIQDILDATSKTAIRLLFDNEVLRSDRISTVPLLEANNSGEYTEFICGKAGTYDINIDILIDIVLDRNIEETYGYLGFLIELWRIQYMSDVSAFPNGYKYSKITENANYIFALEKPALDIDIDIYPFRFFLKGYDVISLDVGDRLYFNLLGTNWSDMLLNQNPKPRCINVLTEGRMSVEYRSCKSDEINTPIQL